MTRLAESYNCYSCSRGTSFSESFHWYKEGEIPKRKGKYTVITTNTKTQQPIKNTKIPCVTCITQLFVRHLPKWSKLRYVKSEVLQVPQKMQAVLVYYLLLGTRSLVYSYTGCGTSKIHSCLEDNRSSFSKVSLKSKTKDVRP